MRMGRVKQTKGEATQQASTFSKSSAADDVSLAPLLMRQYQAAARAAGIFDCIIVGCGPVGAFAGCLLSRYGLTVAIIEKDTAPFSAPRAVAMDDETVRLMGLHSPELAAWMDGHTLKCPVDLRSGPASSRSSYSLIGPMPPFVVETSGYHDTVFFHQPELEIQLRCLLASYPNTTLKLGVEATKIYWEKDPPTAPPAPPDTASATDPFPDDMVCVELEKVGGLGNRTIRGKWLIGADGGASFIRKSLGIAFEGNTFPDQPWIVIDVETHDAAIADSWQCFNFICDPARPFVHVPLPNAAGGRRFEFMLLRDESPDEMLKPQKIDELLHAIGVEPKLLKIVRTAVYTFHARVARDWMFRNCVLMGDSAHCMPPFRGQGMCAGLRDAANVCWRIATTCSANLNPRQLMATYQVEREQHLRSVTTTAVTMGKLITVQNYMLAGVRNLIFCALYKFPPTKLFFKEPFAPPTALRSGLFDFHSLALLPWWGGPKKHEISPFLHDGWKERDRAIGTLIPNFPVHILRDSPMRLDAVLTPSGGLPAAPSWFLVLAPRFVSVLQRATNSGPHTDTISGIELVAKTFKLIGLPIVQLLPPSGSEARIAAHRAHVAAASATTASTHPCITQWQNAVRGRQGKGEDWFSIADVSIADTACKFDLWFKEHHAEAALVRPDRFVFGMYNFKEFLIPACHISKLLVPRCQTAIVRQRPKYWVHALAESRVVFAVLMCIVGVMISQLLLRMPRNWIKMSM